MRKISDHTTLLVLGLILVIAIGFGCLTQGDQPLKTRFNLAPVAGLPNDFSQPDNVFRLPSILKEISGLSYWNDHQLISIQDEKGIVFLYDIRQEKVIEEWRFGKDRDYEGIANKNNEVYVLEMDGDIHQFAHQEGGILYDSEKIETPFNSNNDLEGLCYDLRSDRLLMVPKAKQISKTDQKLGRHGIYAFDINAQKLKEQPAFVIDEAVIGKIVYGKEQAYKIKPSGIAVHPKTGHLYVLASVGKALIIIDRQNNVLHLELLDPSLFPQPEGITFSPNGDLFISSEGKGSEPIIAQYLANEAN